MLQAKTKEGNAGYKVTRVGSFPLLNYHGKGPHIKSDLSFNITFTFVCSIFFASEQIHRSSMEIESIQIEQLNQFRRNEYKTINDYHNFQFGKKKIYIFYRFQKLQCINKNNNAV